MMTSSYDRRPDLELDMHLHSHVKALYDEIRSRALVQYFSPFVTVDLNRMAAAFNSPVGQLESELAGLIMGGKISARIDSHNKVTPHPLEGCHCVTRRFIRRLGGGRCCTRATRTRGTPRSTRRSRWAETTRATRRRARLIDSY